MPSEIFGTSVFSAYSAFAAWESVANVVSCVGDGTTAVAHVNAGLLMGNLYIFRIQVTNPEMTPNDNKWHIECGGESSDLFDGFTLWTFTRTSTTPMSNAVTLSNLVNISFSPFNDIATTISSSAEGVLLLTAPSGFSFGDVGVDCALLETMFSLGDAEETPTVEDSTFVNCTRLSDTMLRFSIPASSALVSGIDYKLVVSVNNSAVVSSAQSWRLESFSDVDMITPLDIVDVPGFPICDSTVEWTYSYLGSGLHVGGAALDDLSLSVRLPDSLNHGDTLVFSAPWGYDLGPKSPYEGDHPCNDLTFPADSHITNSSEILCEENVLTVLVQESTSLTSGGQILFSLDTTNPAVPSPWSTNYWRVEHRDASGLLSANLWSSWDVVPLLQDVHAVIAGSISGGGQTQLHFGFTPVTSASEVVIQGVSPGWDFTETSALPQDQVATDNQLDRVTVTVDLFSAIPVVIKLNFVGLPSDGGPAVFDITTYSSDVIVNQLTDYEGFRSPGEVAVTAPLLQSPYMMDPALHPVTSLWFPQLSSLAIASFSLTFGSAAGVGSIFRIIATSYTLSFDDFSLVDTVSSEQVALVHLPTLSVSDTLECSLQQELTPATTYALTLSTVTPIESPSSTRWVFQTTDDGEFPINHNEVDLTSEFHVVGAFIFAISVLRSPPLATVEASVSVYLGEVRPDLLTLVAPIGFSFPDQCLYAGGNAITSCIPGKFTAERNTATLIPSYDSLTGNSILGLFVYVITPQNTPADPSWQLEGTISGEQVAWGEDSSGLVVMQMSDTSVLYAGVPEINARVAVTFRTRVTLDAGSTIQVQYPSTFTYVCAESLFWLLSLPGGSLACEQEGSVLVRLNTSLPAGKYAFALDLFTPGSTPIINEFAVILSDSSDIVQDGALGLVGQTIRDLSLQAELLTWTLSDAGQVSTVGVTFTVSANIVPATFGQILITLPENWAHVVELTSDVESSTYNNSLPLAPEPWVDFSLEDKLIVTLNVSQAIVVGQYRLRFPVSVPEQIPAYNVWRLTFCESVEGASCMEPSGANSLLTFPIVGFNHGDVSPDFSVSGATARGGLFFNATLLVCAFYFLGGSV
uniref:Uncharacterized protein n=1 Tax=Noctiluca scintillans TaxID=2966 RepID=A0A7S1A1Q2_NOCSC